MDAFITAYRDGKIASIMQDYHKGEKSVACPFCSTYVSIPEGAEVGDEFQCSVCHRRIELQKRNEAYYGVLVAVADAVTPSSPHAEPSNS